jgi:hypothetical protein
MRLFYHIAVLLFLFCSVAKSENGELPSSELASALQLDNLADITARNPKAELYRLTVERSFDSVLVFEIDQDALYIRKARAIHNQEADNLTTTYRLVRNSRIKLESEAYKSFQTLLEASSFWNLPTSDWLEPGLDGSSWKLEGIKAGKYHCVERSNPFIKGLNTPLNENLKSLPQERALFEGRLVSAFMYLWGLSADANEVLY